MSIVFIDAPQGQQEFISVQDFGVTRGDGAFETLLAVKKDHHFEILQLQYHLERLDESLHALELETVDHASIIQASQEALIQESQNTDETEFVVRFFVTAGLEKNNRTKLASWVTARPRPAAIKQSSENGVNIMSLSKGHSASFAQKNPWALQGVKSISYATNMATLRYAKAHGHDDAIYTTEEGFILEAPTSNVVILKDNKLFTPDPGLGLLHGTTQRSIFDAAQKDGYTTSYERLSLDDIANADAAWLTSSVRLFTPLKTIDKVTLDSFRTAQGFAPTLKKWVYKTESAS